jgi:hypothetical protein
MGAKPSAAMIDYSLTARPGTKSEDLACQLVNHGIPTVLITKDRDVVDRVRIICHGNTIPIYFKRRLISDSDYVQQLIQNLGGSPSAEEEIHFTERLHLLQEKELQKTLSRTERRELRTLLARLRLEETEEASRIELAQSRIEQDVDSLIAVIRELTNQLTNELKGKNAVPAKGKLS